MGQATLKEPGPYGFDRLGILSLMILPTGDPLSMTQISIRAWLNELRTTALPQNHGSCGTPQHPCALTLALVMADNWPLKADGSPDPLVTGPAKRTLGAKFGGRLDEALSTVWEWNDNLKLTFSQIADRFEEEFPHLIGDPE